MQQHIYLLRHGKVTGNAALYGATDVAVTADVNKAICSALAATKIKFDHIYSSPLQRCKKLAQLLSQNVSTENSLENVNDVTIVEDLKEMHFGVFDGVAFDDLYQTPAKWQLLEDFWQSPSQNPLPQAEFIATFSERVITAWHLVLNSINKPHSSKIFNIEKHHLIVCHGGVIRMILASILNDNINEPDWYQRYNIPYGSLTQLTLTHGEISVKSIGLPSVKLTIEPNEVHAIKDGENE